jgi:hypothetical protein
LQDILGDGRGGDSAGTELNKLTTGKGILSHRNFRLPACRFELCEHAREKHITAGDYPTKEL